MNKQHLSQPSGCGVLRTFHVALAVAALLLALDTPAMAEPVFSVDSTRTCVAGEVSRSPARGGHTVLDCVGRSAQACMATRGGDSTMGMMSCLQSELTYWDGRLNAAYGKRLTAAKTEDASKTSIRGSTVSQVDALRRMQRAWISYRDAACLYEQAQWLGGTGAGPATMACQLHETARQALKLEGWWSQ